MGLIFYSYENLLKPDLEVALEEHMRVYQNQLSNDSSLEPFYKRIATSPVKRETSNAITSSAITSGEDVKKPRARRQTKAREEIEPPP